MSKIMKTKIILIFVFAIFASCSKVFYTTNGETIYRTGKNLNGEKLLDKTASRIKIVNSCQNCHGKNGDRMKNTIIKFSNLSNPNNYAVPYNDTLFFKFLDHDLKSNGTKANIGVIWKMSDKDKKDLLEYLKTM